MKRRTEEELRKARIETPITEKLKCPLCNTYMIEEDFIEHLSKHTKAERELIKAITARELEIAEEKLRKIT